MATIMIGSARIDERGKLSGGSVGDQKQTSSTNDTKGEVSMQPFYVHSKGWYILRPKNAALAAKMAERMTAACNTKISAMTRVIVWESLFIVSIPRQRPSAIAAV